MDFQAMILILAVAGLPIFILIPFQVLLTLKARKPVVQIIPSLLCTLGIVTVLVFLPDHDIFKLLVLLYLILLLILCGTGWVIAWSIKKAKRS